MVGEPHVTHPIEDTANTRERDRSMQPVRVFISYAWEDEEYRFWVRRLATTLRRDGVDARLDYWHQQSGQDFPSFMNAEVRLADRVLVLGSPNYRTKVREFEEMVDTTGAGWEMMLLTVDLFKGNRGKVAVAVALGSREDSLPSFLQTQTAPSARKGLPAFAGIAVAVQSHRPFLPPQRPVGEQSSLCVFHSRLEERSRFCPPWQ